jgi:hypothetical protein
MLRKIGGKKCCCLIKNANVGIPAKLGSINGENDKNGDDIE